jgi:DNA invertase Pin-like site-specific DNA recombinase
MNELNKPVFGYLRVSGRGQIEGDGFDRQMATIERFCAATGRRVVRWFKDGAVSGEVDTADREGFAEMISLTGEATTMEVIVERADRLGRTLAVCEIACEEARKIGVTILEAASETDLTNSDDPTRVLIRQVLGSLAEWNKNVQVKRLRDARQRIKQRTGRCEGAKPNPIPHDTLSLIWVMRANGWDYRRVAGELNRRKVATLTGKGVWGPSAVVHALQRAINDAPKVVLAEGGKVLDGLAV